jgi:hypothetical protein
MGTVSDRYCTHCDSHIKNVFIVIKFNPLDACQIQIVVTNIV